MLSSFRLIIVVIKGYRDGLKTIKALRQYRTQILEFSTTVGNLHVIFENNIEQLLDPIVLSSSQMALLLNHPVGPEWEKPELAERLKTRLSNSYDSYMSTVMGMNETLEKLQYELGIVDGKVISSSF